MPVPGGMARLTWWHPVDNGPNGVHYRNVISGRTLDGLPQSGCVGGAALLAARNYSAATRRPRFTSGISSKHQ